MVDEEPPDPWRSINELAGLIREAGNKVDDDREANKELVAALEKRTKASIRKMRWYRFAGVVGAVLAVPALWAGWRANDAIDQIRTQRSASRIIACQNDNTTAAKVNALNDRTQQLLRNAVAGGTTRTPEQDARAEAFLRSELNEYQKTKVPMRDCSPAAVERFYSKP